MSSAAAQLRYDEYAKLISQLKEVIQASQNRVLEDNPDPLFANNVNFFVKAYLVSLCTYLEAFLQDISFLHVCSVNEQLLAAKVPHNLVAWSLSKDFKDKDMRFDTFNLSTTRKELADELSGNPGKTINLFRYIGIDLQASEDFKKHKDFVGTVVAKRNNIIHHNDSAADVSMIDLLTYADQFLKYMKSVANCMPTM